MTIHNKYPLFRIDELFDQLQGAAIFSKIGLSSSYHQLKIMEKDIPKVAFQTHYKHYEFVIMSFGLTSSLAAFISLVNEVYKLFLDLFVILFSDDIVVYSKSKKEHESHLRMLWGCLRRINYMLIIQSVSSGFF